MRAPAYATHWSDPPPLVIDDAEKNRAVTRIEVDLAIRNAEQANPGLAFVRLGGGEIAVVDAADRDAVRAHRWAAGRAPRRKTVYAVARVGGRMIYLHRFLWERWGNAPARFLDHKNTNGLDCRRDNLRPATKAQNMRNTGLRADNTSGAKGVSWNAGAGMWRADIKVNGKPRFLGHYRTVDEAARARDAAAATLHGEFARGARGEDPK